MKKLSLFLMALVLSASVMAYDTAVSGTEYYGSKCKCIGLDDGTVAICTFYLEEGQAEVVMPATIQVYNDEDLTTMIAEYEVSQVGYSTWGTLWFDLNGGSSNSISIVTKITLSEGIKIINTSAFWGASALKTLELPASITTVGDYSFGSCDALETIICKAESAPTCGTDAFKGGTSWDAIGNQCKVYVPSETAKATYDQQGGSNGLAWSYWGVFYAAGNVVVDSSILTNLINAEVAPTQKATKILHDGKVLILHNGKVYNMLGAEMQ